MRQHIKRKLAKKSDRFLVAANRLAEKIPEAVPTTLNPMVGQNDQELIDPLSDTTLEANFDGFGTSASSTSAVVGLDWEKHVVGSVAQPASGANGSGAGAQHHRSDRNPLFNPHTTNAVTVDLDDDLDVLGKSPPPVGGRSGSHNTDLSEDFADELDLVDWGGLYGYGTSGSTAGHKGRKSIFCC